MSTIADDRLGGRSIVFGDSVNTDVIIPGRYLVSIDPQELAKHAFEPLGPEVQERLYASPVVVAGRNFGINSSREQAVHVMHRLGVAAIIAPSFGRQFYRNAINNGMPVVECDTAGIAAGDAVELDLAGGRISVPARNIARTVPPLPAAVQALLSAGGLIPFLQKHPDWNLGELAA